MRDSLRPGKFSASTALEGRKGILYLAAMEGHATVESMDLGPDLSSNPVQMSRQPECLWRDIESEVGSARN